MVDMAKPDRRAKIDLLVGNPVHYYDLGNSLLTFRADPNTRTVSGGFQAVDFEGKEFVAVDALPAGVVYGLETKQFKYVVLEDFETKPKSTNKDSDRFIITHYANLVCRHPGHQFKIIDLRTSSGIAGW